ncbi:MAG: hypothetical protein AAGH64_02340 [Planctomycetota bacterium]
MRPLAATLALLVCLLLPAHATAQDYIISDPRFDDDQRDCIIMTLRLDDEQRDAFDDLAVLYAMEIADIFAEVESMGEEIEQRDDFTVEEGVELWKEISARVIARQDRLFDDLSLFLTEEQTGRIQRCRDRLRRMGITSGDLSAPLPGGFSMGTDPVLLAVEMGLPDELEGEPRAAFERALETYDAAITRNIDALIEDILDLIEESDGFQGFEENPLQAFTALADEIDRVVKGAKALREDHQSLGLAVARSLPEASAAEWTDAFTRALYPGPYRRIDSEVLLDRLLEQPSLTAEEVGTVLDLTAELASRTATVRAEWCEKVDDFLTDFEFNFLALMSLNPNGVSAPFRERMREIDERYLERIPERVQNPVVQDLIDALFDPTETESDSSKRGAVEVRIETGP